jgi:hypothetical protein
VADAFADLADLPEDHRIRIIGQLAEAGTIAMFIVEDDEKADRYLRKMREWFKIRVVSRGLGPVPHTVRVTVGPLES